MPTNTPGMESRFPLSLLLLGWLACTKSSFRIPGYVYCPFGRCSPLQGRLSITADVASVHHICSKFHHPAQYPCVERDSGLVPFRCSSAAFSVLAWPSTSTTTRSMIPLDWLSPTGGLSGTVWLPSWRACAISLAGASIAGSLSHLSVTLLCPTWSMNFPALFAI